MCSRGTLLASLKSSIVFSLIFFVMYPQYFLSQRSISSVYPHCWSLLSLTMENMCLTTTFTRGEVSARKDGSEISSSSFPSDEFRTRPQSYLDVLLSTARIVLSSSLTMTSMIKSYNIMHPLPYSELQKPPYFLIFPQSSLGTHVLLILLLSYTQHHTSGVKIFPVTPWWSVQPLDWRLWRWWYTRMS